MVDELPSNEGGLRCIAIGQTKTGTRRSGLAMAGSVSCSVCWGFIIAAGGSATFVVEGVGRDRAQGDAMTPTGHPGWRRKRGVGPRYGNPHQLTPLNSNEFKARPTEPQEDCVECWAAQFICPYCGPCTNGMVMTTKCCLRCGNGLIRALRIRCPAHQTKEERP